MSGMLYLVPTPSATWATCPTAFGKLCRGRFYRRRRHPSLFEAAEPFGAEKTAGQLFEHNRAEVVPRIVQRLLAGETCALVTDAGTPAISDPGEDLVALCAQAGITVCAIPGPCAVITALAVSGLPQDGSPSRDSSPPIKKAAAAIWNSCGARRGPWCSMKRPTSCARR